MATTSDGALSAPSHCTLLHSLFLLTASSNSHTIPMPHTHTGKKTKTCIPSFTLLHSTLLHTESPQWKMAFAPHTHGYSRAGSFYHPVQAATGAQAAQSGDLPDFLHSRQGDSFCLPACHLHCCLYSLSPLSTSHYTPLRGGMGYPTGLPLTSCGGVGTQPLLHLASHYINVMAMWLCNILLQTLF